MTEQDEIYLELDSLKSHNEQLENENMVLIAELEAARSMLNMEGVSYE